MKFRITLAIFVLLSSSTSITLGQGIGGAGAGIGTGGAIGGIGIGGIGGAAAAGQTGIGQAGTAVNPFTTANLPGPPFGFNAPQAGAYGIGGSGAAVGARQGQVQGGVAGQQLGGALARGALAGGLNRGFGAQRGGLLNQNQNQRAGGQRTVRAVIRAGADFPKVTPAVTQQNVNNLLPNLPLPERFKSINVVMSQRTEIINGVDMTERIATVRGSVAKEDDKLLVERLLKLEPGIDSIQNELIVMSNPPIR